MSLINLNKILYTCDQSYIYIYIYLHAEGSKFTLDVGLVDDSKLNKIFMFVKM